MDDRRPLVLALAVDPDDLEVRYITPGSCDTLEDSIATRAGRVASREVEWADALVLPSGEAIDAFGRAYGSTEQWLAALGARDVTRQLRPKREAVLTDKA